MDARPKLAGSEYVDERAHAGAALLDQMIPGVDGELAQRRRILARPQGRLQIERRLAAEPAVDDQRAARREHGEVAGNARSADRIDDGVDAAALGDRVNRLADF